MSGGGNMFNTVDDLEDDLRELLEFLREHPDQKKLVLDVMRVQKKAIEGMANAAKPVRKLKPRTA